MSNKLDILKLLAKMEEENNVEAPGMSSEDQKLISKYFSAIQVDRTNQARRRTEDTMNQESRSVTLEDKQRPEMKRASYSTASLSSLDDESLADASIGMNQEQNSRPLRVQDRVNDPFLYYSSDKRRMETLLGTELPGMPLDEQVKRKTRISFELDPMYDMMTSFPDLFDLPGLDEDLDDSVLDRFEMAF